MDTKAIALVIAFAALTVALNAIRMPTFYWPGFNYRVYEIPIVVAFLLFGFKIGILISALNVPANWFSFQFQVGSLLLRLV